MASESPPPAPASLFRRVAAQFYDFLLAAALWLIASFAVLPLTGGEAITTATHGVLAWLYFAWLLVVAFSYFGLCWVRGGQTLGLRAWSCRLLSADGGTIGWRGAALRFAGGLVIALPAIAGVLLLARPGWKPSDAAALALLLPAIANLAWIRFDAEGRSLQDLAAATRIVRVSR